MRIYVYSVCLIVAFIMTITSGYPQKYTNSDEPTIGKVWLSEFANTSEGGKNIQSFVNDFYRNLKLITPRKTEANQDRLVKRLFYKLHNKYLKKYHPESTFSQTIENGEYNCLTATALYMLSLDYYNIPYSVVEKSSHIFIVVRLPEVRLIETTDPRHGYIHNKVRINEILKTGDIVNFSVSYREVIGLMYYNNAALSYKQGDFERYKLELEKARNYYNSQRISNIEMLVAKREDAN